jgi:hypothetical protein
VSTSIAPTPAQRAVRSALTLGYAGVVVAGFTQSWMPRLFWTVLLPILPLAIVLMGFPNWRRICPLAFVGELGRKLNRGTQRRVPAWLESGFFPFTFTILLGMLVLRLVATNGDGVWLAGLLVALAVAAILVNRIFTGKSWCNFFCPVGVVERIYTEPNSLVATPSSQCTQCTACKRHCPDIDQENAYWKDVAGSGRRFVFYAFPGLVLAFYVYYWLRAGDWDAYFDGRWTLVAASPELALGPGFFFAPEVPAVVAATMTLVLFSMASLVVGLVVEAVFARRVADPEKRRHLVLSLSAFAAFNIFYLFAGAPSLREVAGGTRALAFVAPLVGTVFLAKRWRRTREHFIGDQGARRLLRSWPFDEAPPSDPAEVYGWINASRHAREKDEAAYAATVREMIADGLVGPGELRLLEGVRKQLGISEKEHERILARLSEEERHLFEQSDAAGPEARAQLEGYQSALGEALLRGAPRGEIDELRQGFGVSEQDHERVLEALRGASGAILTRARRQLDRALELDRDMAALGATEPSAPRVFLRYLLTRERDEAVDRLFELLEVAGDGPMVQALRRRLLAGSEDKKTIALELLIEACPGSEDVVAGLRRIVVQGERSAVALPAGIESAILLRLLAGTNPFLRAGAVWAAANHGDEPLLRHVASATGDRHPLVRETAERFGPGGVGGGLPGGGGAPTLSTIETMYFLHAVAFFRGLDPEDLHDLALFAFEETVEPPAAICQAGDINSDSLFVLLSGRAEVVPAGEPMGGEGLLPPRSLAPGDIVGELSVLDGSPRDATVRPLGGPARVLRIPGQNFRSGLLRRPGVTESLFATLAGRIRRLSRSGA